MLVELCVKAINTTVHTFQRVLHIQCAKTRALELVARFTLINIQFIKRIMVSREVELMPAVTVIDVLVWRVGQDGASVKNTAEQAAYPIDRVHCASPCRKSI